TEHRFSARSETDLDPSRVPSAVLSSHELSIGKAAHDHRNGALVGGGLPRQLTDGKSALAVELLEDKELGTAHAGALFGRARRNPQHTDHVTKAVHHGPCVAFDRYMGSHTFFYPRTRASARRAIRLAREDDFRSKNRLLDSRR